jgi:2-keto-3-deoxy-L-rhamnonate aldolase RhmA
MSLTMRDMVAARRLKLGTFVVEFDSPGMGQILKAAGCEFAIIDMEHSGFGYDSLKRMLRYYQAAGLPTIVSTAVGDYDVIARACDMGADAIQPAKVSSAAEAREMLNHMRYPPKGHRGVALAEAVETGVALNRMGFDFLCYSGELWLLRDGLKARLDSLRAACRKAQRRN